MHHTLRGGDGADGRLVMLASLAGAQQPGQKGKGKFGGGFGFGGGVGPGGLPPLVLTNKALQGELKITPEQTEKLKPVTEKQVAMQKKQAEMFGGFGKGKGGGFDKEKAQEFFKEFQAVQEEAKKAVDQTLNEKQKTRLKQIEVQAMGVRAFTDEDASKQLNLTDSQKTKIKGVADEFQKDRGEAMRELFQGGGFGDAEKRAEVDRKVEKMQKAAMTQIEAALTDDQKKTWKTMVGEPFDVTKLRQIPRKVD